jgi:hypothetical protein
MKKSTLTFVSFFFFAAFFLSNNAVLAQTGSGGKTEDGWINWYDDSDLADPDSELEPSFLATPNPSNGENLKVYFERLQGAASISLFDMSGRLHEEKTVGENHQSSGMTTFSLSSLSTGIYFVKMTNGLYESVQKIMIR